MICLSSNAARSYLLLSSIVVEHLKRKEILVSQNVGAVKGLTLEGVGFLAELVKPTEQVTALSLTQFGANGADKIHLKVGYAHRVSCRVPSLVSVQIGRFEGVPARYRKGFYLSQVGSFLQRVRGVKAPSVYKKRGLGTLKDWNRPRKVVVKK